jgi:hypothetical protein
MASTQNYVHREIFIPHSAIVVGDAAEHRISAVASTVDIDRYNSIVVASGMRPVKGPIPLLAHHDNRKVAGVIEQIDRQADRIVFDAKVTDPAIWQDIVSGGLAGVSIGFLPYKFEGSDPEKIVDWELIEISLVSTPANSSAVILEARSMQTSPSPSPAPGTSVVPAAPRVIREVPASAPAIQRRGYPRFSLASVITAAVRQERLVGFEGEICAELERRSDIEARGVRVPGALFQPRSPHYAARAVSTDVGSAAALSPEQWLQSLLDDVATARRWGTLSNRLGFTVVSSLRETIHVPKRVTRAQAGWGPKDANAAETDTTFDEDVLAPRYAHTTITLKRSALRYSDPAIDVLASRDLGEALDDTVDAGLLFGTGANDMPIGLLTQPSFEIDRAGQPVTQADLAALKANQITTWKLDDAAGSLRWAINPVQYDTLRVTSMRPAPPATPGEWTQGIVPVSPAENMVMGIGCIQSGRLEGRAVNGVLSADIHLVMGGMGVICYFGGASVDLIVDPYSLSTAGSVRVTGFVDVNCVARDLAIDVRVKDAAV